MTTDRSGWRPAAMGTREALQWLMLRQPSWRGWLVTAVGLALLVGEASGALEAGGRSVAAAALLGACLALLTGSVVLARLEPLAGLALVVVAAVIGVLPGAVGIGPLFLLYAVLYAAFAGDSLWRKRIQAGLPNEWPEADALPFGLGAARSGAAEQLGLEVPVIGGRDRPAELKLALAIPLLVLAALVLCAAGSHAGGDAPDAGPTATALFFGADVAGLSTLGLVLRQLAGRRARRSRPTSRPVHLKATVSAQGRVRLLPLGGHVRRAMATFNSADFAGSGLAPAQREGITMGLHDVLVSGPLCPGGWVRLRAEAVALLPRDGLRVVDTPNELATRLADEIASGSLGGTSRMAAWTVREMTTRRRMRRAAVIGTAWQGFLRDYDADRAKWLLLVPAGVFLFLLATEAESSEETFFFVLLGTIMTATGLLAIGALLRSVRAAWTEASAAFAPPSGDGA
ncbi:MAG: hypothetical protein LWW86_03010 [Micrococcales bacterium]|nr:hypothetical protein [Micrococcales bacterium]